MEKLTVREHQVVSQLQGRTWRRADAYRWIRYEAENPLDRLLLAGDRLEMEWKALLAGATPEVISAWREFCQQEAAAVAAAESLEAGLKGEPSLRPPGSEGPNRPSCLP